ncbi:MAG: ABC transporter substrate-binding protein [Lachnospiraceae bacterium]|nr:ABC transporter substrate-binding protein [Lachnospiraceae bacterium]
MKLFQKFLALVLAAAMTMSLLTGCTVSGSETRSPETTEAPADADAQTDAPTDAPTNPPTDAPTDAPAGIIVTDMMGREITLTEPATRVVALTASDCEILYAIGAGDTLVGRGEYCDYPAEVFDVPSVESGYEMNLEQVIALQPQVLLMSTMAQSKEQVESLEKAGIQVVVSNAQDIEGTYEAISLIGALMGKDAEAQAIIDNMKTTFDDLAAKVSANTGEEKTVYFEVSPLEYGLWAAGNNTFMNEIAEMLGLTNIFADVDGWGAVSEEQVLTRDPDYIVTISMYFGEGPTPVEEILGRTGWENVTAVKNSAILNLQNNELSRPAPRLADGAQMMYDFVYEAK